MRPPPRGGGNLEGKLDRFVRVRQRGSHVVMQKRTAQTTVTVPVPLHPELHRGTLLSIIRQSAIPRAAFEYTES